VRSEVPVLPDHHLLVFLFISFILILKLLRSSLWPKVKTSKRTRRKKVKLLRKKELLKERKGINER